MTNDELREHAEKISWIVMIMAQHEPPPVDDDDINFAEMVAKVLPVPGIVATPGNLSPGRVNGLGRTESGSGKDVREWICR